METVYLKIPKDPQFMLAVRLLAAGIGNIYSFNTEDIEDLKVAVSEACFCSPEEGTPALELTFFLDEGKMTVEVKGASSGKKPTLTLGKPAQESIGLLLMQNLMNSLEFKKDENCSLIRMTKKSRTPILPLSGKS
ncbi:MAG: ATP-binding protein [Firmicutes bacterium]|jgi:anti-sigma regulatory factor (Ser/Thr protein kinase)|nr:ATP-binding protein [Bacillota bacterium]